MEAPPVIVTGNPVGSDLMDLASPADVLHGATLRARLAANALDHARSRSWRASMDQLVAYYRVAQRLFRLTRPSPAETSPSERKRTR